VHGVLIGGQACCSGSLCCCCCQVPLKQTTHMGDPLYTAAIDCWDLSSVIHKPVSLLFHLDSCSFGLISSVTTLVPRPLKAQAGAVGLWGCGAVGLGLRDHCESAVSTPRGGRATQIASPAHTWAATNLSLMRNTLGLLQLGNQAIV